MVTDGRDVRCPDCSRLLAKRLPNGALEIRHGDRSRVLMRDGEITCVRCEITVATGPSPRQRRRIIWGDQV